jgi:hypothetical protein
VFRIRVWFSRIQSQEATKSTKNFNTKFIIHQLLLLKNAFVGTGICLGIFYKLRERGKLRASFWEMASVEASVPDL